MRLSAAVADPPTPQSRDQSLSSLYFGIVKFVGLFKPLLLEMSASELHVPKQGVRLGEASRKDGTGFFCHPDNVF